MRNSWSQLVTKCVYLVNVEFNVRSAATESAADVPPDLEDVVVLSVLDGQLVRAQGPVLVDAAEKFACGSHLKQSRLMQILIQGNNLHLPITPFAYLHFLQTAWATTTLASVWPLQVYDFPAEVVLDVHVEGSGGSATIASQATRVFLSLENGLSQCIQYLVLQQCQFGFCSVTSLSFTLFLVSKPITASMPLHFCLIKTCPKMAKYSNPGGQLCGT